jgi:hypothetical protein
LDVAQVQAGHAHFFYQTLSGCIVADLAYRHYNNIFPQQYFYIMRDDMQLAIIPAVDEMPAAALFAAQGMLSIQQEKRPAADPTHAQHCPGGAGRNITLQSIHADGFSHRKFPGPIPDAG